MCVCVGSDGREALQLSHFLTDYYDWDTVNRAISVSASILITPTVSVCARVCLNSQKQLGF